MASLFSRQPWKALWVTLFFATLLPRIAVMALYFIPSSLHQHPKWTFHNALGNAIFKALWSFMTTIEYAPPKSLEPGKDKERFINLEPAAKDKYQGCLDDPEIRPTTIGGMWYPALYDRAQDKDHPVVLHFHGGAYVLGGCRPMEGGWGPEELAKHMSGLSFCPQYRLASHPKSRFPAALQDAVSSYNYLLDLGIPASQIIISGDSAGGNLALALLRYVNAENLLQRPRACFLWSPWLDLTVIPKAIESNRNYNSDYLPPSLLEWALRAFKPDSIKATDPYISPLNNEFSTDVPIFVHTGTAEVLHDDHTAFVRNMKSVQGNRIELLETPNASHDIFAAGPILGFIKEAEAAMDVAITFLEGQK